MAKRARKTLPRNLDELLKAAAESGDEAQVRAALETCLPDARGGYGTILSQRGCTASIARWAIERGTDVNATDTGGRTALHAVASYSWSSGMSIEDLIGLGARIDVRCAYGCTALHYAAAAQNLPAVQALLAQGLDPNDRGTRGHTPLEWALERLMNIGFPAMVPVAEALLAAGAQVSDASRESAQKAAENFEFHRPGFNPDFVEETAAAVHALCRLLGVQPLKPRRIHDGASPIVATTTTWQAQHEELWGLLVPSKGACQTVQGEVIRITGKISHELFGNGGGNWDRNFRAMANALLRHLGSSIPLDAEQIEEARAVASGLLDDMNGANRLAELAVAWVARNPAPLPLEPPSYRR